MLRPGGTDDISDSCVMSSGGITADEVSDSRGGRVKGKPGIIPMRI